MATVAVPGQSAASTSVVDVRVAMPQAPDAGRVVVASPVPNVADAAVTAFGGVVPARLSTGLTGGSGEGTIGLGNLGTVGGSRVGHGVSWGSSSRDPRVPLVRLSAATVLGALPSEVVRRVVMRHVAEVRYCYERGLMVTPTLEGRVIVRFVISPAGSVLSSTIAESTLATPLVEQCVATAVRRWMFPSPEGGGIVTVSYPFTFRTPE